jgi:hypothetical protein
MNQLLKAVSLNKTCKTVDFFQNILISLVEDESSFSHDFLSFNYFNIDFQLLVNKGDEIMLFNHVIEPRNNVFLWKNHVFLLLNHVIEPRNNVFLWKNHVYLSRSNVIEPRNNVFLPPSNVIEAGNNVFL